MKPNSLLELLPAPQRMAVPFALLLGLELLLNRVLTRISVFLPPATATPMTIVSGLGTVLMAAVSLLAFVLLASLIFRGKGPLRARVVAGLLLAAVGLSFAFPSAGLAALVLSPLAVALFALPEARERKDLFAAGLLIGGLSAVGFFHLANGVGLAGDVWAPPIAYLVGETLFLCALGLMGLFAFGGRARISSLILSASLVAVLLALYLRAPSLFATVALWSLGYGLFLPPVFFATVWLVTAGILAARGRVDSTEAARLGILAAAGIDIRVSYLAIALVFAAALGAEKAQEEESPAKAADSLIPSLSG